MNDRKVWTWKFQVEHAAVHGSQRSMFKSSRLCVLTFKETFKATAASRWESQRAARSLKIHPTWTAAEKRTEKRPVFQSVQAGCTWRCSTNMFSLSLVVSFQCNTLSGHQIARTQSGKCAGAPKQSFKGGRVWGLADKRTHKVWRLMWTSQRSG